MKRTYQALAALTILSASAGASAGIIDSWPLLAFDTEADCELRIAGNGRFIEIGASGLIPGEALEFTLTNGTIKPIMLGAFANGRGEWSKLYIPFHFDEEGGTVSVRLNASRCSLDASVPWKRGVRTIP